MGFIRMVVLSCAARGALCRERSDIVPFRGLTAGVVGFIGMGDGRGYFGINDADIYCLHHSHDSKLA